MSDTFSSNLPAATIIGPGFSSYGNGIYGSSTAANYDAVGHNFQQNAVQQQKQSDVLDRDASVMGAAAIGFGAFGLAPAAAAFMNYSITQRFGYLTSS